jgi:poly(hydroxyalkanoate) depolymerase family esterase
LRLRLAVPLGLAIGTTSLAASAGTVTVEQHFGRSVRVFVPTTPASPTPLVVMLHGCTQTAEGFADATQMDAIAETSGFVVAYPEQSSDTIATKCFRWYEPAHQARDAGEPKELADTTQAIAAAHGVDPERVYVAGLSAGAAMSVVLGATYPDRFTAIGVVAGIEYRGASSLSEAFTTSSNGGPDPDAQGVLAHAQMGARARAVPVFVVHGTADSVVAKVNGDQVTAQWLKTNTLVLGAGAIDPVVSQSGTAGYPFTRLVHKSKANGASVLEQYVVEGLGHAWPGGKGGGSYSDASGPNASALVWAFFKGRTRSAPLDVPPPVTPPPGQTDGGAPGTNLPADPGSAPAADGGASSGGCSISRIAGPTTWWLGCASIVLTALAIRRARSRRTRTRRPSRRS